ncbi:hypothetical protein TTHERM_001150385 (macronuclear) [Tetrahymena thermophila SB210]|uniref:Uncharacterized protein n=1 Tax=Tetrahymena thermophila (strain SB210) TaxID=312017 RepID=W7X8U5_TETTS|nr:hypothetical protein TTHERM_001150385 [Tetrahymena thermophila SB210]EWS72803.1 hypothetical protein TTHERM_001150385 [Tetrahymena thermophila SB210]|eukprot:XP_012654662.1 hypothetical protein TTHERM_001150385 [Tetrahymena thermophila SB210]
MFISNYLRLKQRKQTHIDWVKICQQRYDQLFWIQQESKGDRSSHFNHKKYQSFLILSVFHVEKKPSMLFNLKQRYFSQVKQAQNVSQRLTLKLNFLLDVQKVQKILNHDKLKLQIFMNIHYLPLLQGENNRSHSNSEVKHLKTGLVLRQGTAWEVPMLITIFFKIENSSQISFKISIQIPKSLIVYLNQFIILIFCNIQYYQKFFIITTQFGFTKIKYIAKCHSKISSFGNDYISEWHLITYIHFQLINCLAQLSRNKKIQKSNQIQLNKNIQDRKKETTAPRGIHQIFQIESGTSRPHFSYYILINVLCSIICIK